MKKSFRTALLIMMAGFILLVLFGMRIGDAFSIVFFYGAVVFVIWMIGKIMEQISRFLKKLFGRGSNLQNQSPVASTTTSAIPYVMPSPQIPVQNNWMSNVHVKDSSDNSDTIAIYDDKGIKLQLGAKNEKGSGGEGTVYELPVNSKFLVKIYKDAILRDSRKMLELRQRIEDMVSLGIFAKTPFLAWPIMPAMNDKKEIIGFVMRKCTGTSFLALRSPRGILQHFPNWTRRELALTALNYVKKVRLLANNQVLVNDFNPSNFLMNANSEVSFIDCDSYQITGPRGVNITRTYFPSHVAPELAMHNHLLDRPRTLEQMEFGVALTVFNILMCGLHPYNYYDPKGKGDCSTPEENLIKGRCPLGEGSDCRFPKGNWYSMWSWLPFNLKSTFIQMFKDGHSNPAARPSLETLQANLEELVIRMGKEPELCVMVPTRPKPKKSKSFFTTPRFHIFATP